MERLRKRAAASWLTHGSKAAPPPIVEDEVVIHAGATIPSRVTIGKGSTIGGKD